MTDALEKPAAGEGESPNAVMQCCGLCDAWVCVDPKAGASGKRMGMCRANPPTPFITQGPPNPLDPSQRPTMQVIAQFPPMPEWGWCRQFDTAEDDAT